VRLFASINDYQYKNCIDIVYFYCIYFILFLRRVLITDPQITAAAISLIYAQGVEYYLSWEQYSENKGTEENTGRVYISSDSADSPAVTGQAFRE
jgi:hypothetical protein